MINTYSKESLPQLYTRPFRAMLGGKQFKVINGNLVNTGSLFKNTITKVISIALLILFPIGLIYIASAAIVLKTSKANTPPVITAPLPPPPAPIPVPKTLEVFKNWSEEAQWESLNSLMWILTQSISQAGKTEDKMLILEHAKTGCGFLGIYQKDFFTKGNVIWSIKKIIENLKPFENYKSELLKLNSDTEVDQFLNTIDENTKSLVKFLRENKLRLTR